MIHALTYHFKADEAWLLCYLASIERTARNLPPEFREAGWFYCTGKKLQRDLGWNDDKQKRVIRKLNDKGFIDTKQKFMLDEHGTPLGGYPVRWVRLNHTAITDAVNAAIEGSAC